MSESTFTLDEKDTAILAELQRNAKQTTGRIAKRTRIPVTTVHNRIKRFEREGVITRYEPRVDYEKLGYGIHALVFIVASGKLPDGRPVDQQSIAQKAARLNGVQSARIVTGEYDLVLDVRVTDVPSLNRTLIKELRTLPGVEKTETMLVLEEL